MSNPLLPKEQDTVGVLAPNIFVTSPLEPFSFCSRSTPCSINKVEISELWTRSPWPHPAQQLLTGSQWQSGTGQHLHRDHVTHCFDYSTKGFTLKQKNAIFLHSLTRAPSSWNMAAAPSRSSGAIFLLQRLRRNVSEERSILWNFQPIREENSQPSGSPLSCLCVYTTKVAWLKTGDILIGQRAL